MNKNKSGFTIVELLIVIVVIAILAAISLVAFSGMQSRARDSARNQEVNSIAKALELYYIDHGRFPVPPNDSTCTGDSNQARSGCSTWEWLGTELQSYTGRAALSLDPINRLGSTTSPDQHAYAYMVMTNNSDWPLLCENNSKTYQAYYLWSYTETGAIKNQIQGNCSNSNPYFGSDPGVRRNNYLVVKP